MLNHIQQTIEELKKQVQSNVSIITKNQDVIKQMMRHSDENEYASKYEVFNIRNRELLSQNNDLINVQLTLINFIEKYKDTAILKPEMPLVDIYSITDVQEIFDLTIKGVMGFNKIHPYFNDLNFIEKLINYYKSKEDYERCIELKKLIENSSI